jgi:membrane protease YdiL (CAAX protease family)
MTMDNTQPESQPQIVAEAQSPTFAGDLSPRSAPPPNHPIHNIFIGSDGLRVPWRIVLYLLMVVAIGLALGGITSRWKSHGAGKLWQGMLFELELAFAVIFSGFVMSKVEKRPFGNYGLPAREAFRKNFWIGAVWGFLWLALLMLIMRGSGVFSFGGLALHGVRIVKFAAFYAVMFLLVGFFEEFLMRGYMQFTLSKGIGFWPAAIALSLLFGAMHLGNTGEAWLGIAAAALIGLFFCLTLHRTGTLWWAVGFHFSWDWGETYFFSVPDSGQMSPGHLLTSSFHGSRWLTGGSVGPEGSVFVLLIILLMAYVFHRVYPQVRYQAEPRISSLPNVI